MNIKFEMAQGIARAIVAKRDEFSGNIVAMADKFILARDYWEDTDPSLWEVDSIGWKYLQEHREEWKGKL